MLKRDIFIGGAWPYANYYLHVGHLAALLPGDILAKYFRGKSDNVIYVSGSDCHGTPITERARKDNCTAEDIATHYHNEFVKTFQKLGFEYDEYSSTMSQHHKDYVCEQFKKIIENGYIFEREELQDYCNKCATFLSDREIEGTCPHCGGKSSGDQCDTCGDSLDSSEVLNKHCKKCGNDITMKENKHLYFKLPEFESGLQDLINKNRGTWRKNALGEAQKYIDMGLVNRAATRQLDWGVHLDNTKEGNMKFFEKDLRDKKVLVIDSIYSGKTLLYLKGKVEEQGGAPYLLGLYPKDKSVLNILDYVCFINKVFRVSNLNNRELDYNYINIMKGELMNGR